MGLALLVVAAPAAGQPALSPQSGGETDPGKRAEREEERLLARATPLDDPVLDAYLAGLVARLVPGLTRAAELPPVRVVVLRDPARNAFSLPHGRIFLSTGLIARLEREDEIALIVARELAHLARGSAGRGAGAPRPAVGPPHLFRGLGLDLAYAAAVTGHGHEIEREADMEALALLARAGFDPEAATRAFDHLRRGLGDERPHQAPFRFESLDHLDERRASFAVLRLAPPPERAPSPGGHDEFPEAARVAVRENAMLEGRAGEIAVARAQLVRAIRLAPGDAVAHLHAGDLDRLDAQRQRDPATRRARREEARISYERAALLAPEWPEPFHRLGLLRYETGNLATAREAFARYLDLAPDGVEARRVREYLDALDPPRRESGPAPLTAPGPGPGGPPDPARP